MPTDIILTSQAASPVTPCTLKVLPPDLWTTAANKAVATNPANAPATHQLARAAPDTIITPEHLALLTTRYWGSGGVRLTVGFLDNPSAALRSKLLSHMNAWGQFGNVQFVETAADAQVRISRGTGGYWSYLGTDILSIGSSQQTMNLDGFTEQTPDSEFYRVVRHETGHTLGFPHEHMRSELVAGIDREKAIAYFMRTQGWSREQVIAQVLTPLNQSALLATAQPDPNSIMCYWLPAEIMTNGVAVPGGRDIDSQDQQFAASVYPPVGSAIPFFRYWNGPGCDHFYTTGWGELGPGSGGWGFEGIQCYVFPDQRPGTVPLYRYWNGGGCDHFYTTNWQELGQGDGGWALEGVQCYVYPDQRPGTVPLHRYWNGGGCDHFYTTSWQELGEGDGGWVYEGVQCYVLAQPSVADAAANVIFSMQRASGTRNAGLSSSFQYVAGAKLANSGPGAFPHHIGMPKTAALAERVAVVSGTPAEPVMHPAHNGKRGEDGSALSITFRLER